MSVGFKLAEAFIDIKARNLMSEVLTPALAQIGALGAAEEGVAAKSGLMGSAGKLALVGIGAAAVGGAVEVTKMAGDFQASTERLVTSAGEAQSNIGLVRDGILGMAGAVGYSAEELSTAMYKVESGGQHGAAGLEVLKAAAEGAKTENAELTTVADALTSAMQDYHAPASEAADITSKLVAATASGKMTFQELAASLSAILPVASANHVSLNDILGDLASMTVHGMSAQQASQNLADAVRHLAAPTQVSQKELALLGLTSQQVSADLSSKGLSGTVQEIAQAIQKNMGPGTTQVVLSLQTALQGLAPPVQELGQKLMEGSITQAAYTKAARGLSPELAGQAMQFATLAKSTHSIGNEQMTGAQVMQTYSGALRQAMGDATGMNVALMLTGENADTTAKAIGAVSSATAQADGHVRGWDEIQGTFNAKLSEAKAGLGAFAISIGSALLPVLTPLVGALGSLANWLSQNQTAAVAVAAVIGGVVTVAFAACAVAAWSFTAALLANPAVWVIAGIVAAVVGLVAVVKLVVDNWSSITDFFSGLWDDVVSVFNSAIDGIGKAMNWLKELPGRVMGWLRDLPGRVGFLLGELIGILLKIGIDSLTAMAHGIAQGAVAVWNFVTAMPGRILNFLVNLPSMLSNLATTAWHAFVSGMTAAAEAIWSFVTSLPGRVLSTLGNLGGLLLGAGKAIIQGLLDGLKAGVGALWDFVSGIAKGIAARKGPLPYDRTLLTPHGNAIMDGLLDGLRSGHERVMDFVGGVAGDLAGGIPTNVPFNVSVGRTGGAESGSPTGSSAAYTAAGGRAGPGAAAGSGGTTNNIYVTAVPTNPMETGRFVALALRSVG